MKLTIIFISAIVVFSACKNSNYSAIDHPNFQKQDLPRAQRLLDSNKIAEGFSFLDSSFHQINLPGYGDQLELYITKATYLFQRSPGKDPTGIALKYTDSAYNFMHENQLQNRYPKTYIHLLFLRGDILLNRGRFIEAYAAYYKAKQHLERVGMNCELAEYHNRLGLIYYKQGKFYNASSLFRKGFENGQKCPETFLEFARNQGALDNAGLSFLKIKMLDSAMAYFRKAQAYVSKKSVHYPHKRIFLAEAHGVILQNIGDTYYQLFNFKQAEENYLKSIEISKRDYIWNPIAMQSEIRLAKLYVETAKLTLANMHLQRAEVMLKNNELDPSSVKNAQFFWYKTKLDYFIAGKLTDSVQILSRKYLQMQKEMTAKDKLFLDADVSEKFYDLQKEYELDILRKQNQLNKLYTLISIILLVAATLILYLMFRYSMRSKSHNKKLTDLNRQITEQNLNLQNALDILEQNQIRHLEVQNVVMHDLRSPITGISLLSDHLKESEHLMDDEKHMIELIKTSSEDALKFINDLLHEGSARMELEKESVDLEKLLNYCVNLLQYKALEKNQKITLVSEPVQFMLNREKIYRVLSNIITNAIKFSPTESVINVSLKVIEERAVIAIQDSGIGIPDEIKKNIFNLQESVRREGTDGEKSYGIGLITSKKIVEAHAGKLWFESTVDKGSTFFVELPILCDVVAIN